MSASPTGDRGAEPGLHSRAMADRSPYAALVERLPVRREELVLRGGRTACWTYGPPDAAHTVVFLHGLRGDHHGLEPITAHLDDPARGGAGPPRLRRLPAAARPTPTTSPATRPGRPSCWTRSAATRCWRGTRSARSSPRPPPPPRRPPRRWCWSTPSRRRRRRRRDPADRRLPPPRRRAAGAGRHRPAAQPGRHPDRERRHGHHTGPGAAPVDPRRARPLLRGLRRPPRAAGGVPRLDLPRRRRVRPRRHRPDAARGGRARRHRAPARPTRARGSPTRGWSSSPPSATSPTTRRPPPSPPRSRSSCAARSRLPLRHAGTAQRHQPLHRRAGARARRAAPADDADQRRAPARPPPGRAVGAGQRAPPASASRSWPGR